MKSPLKLLLSIAIALTLAFPLLASADVGATIGEGIGMAGNVLTLNVPIGNLTSCSIGAGAGGNNCLGLYIKAWYGFALGVVGILATFMIMFAGFKYLTSRGDSGAVGDAKKLIISGISGVIIAFLSYTILSLVNPQLLTISMPTLPGIKDTSGITVVSSAKAIGSGGSNINQTGKAGEQDQAIKDACAKAATLDYKAMTIPAKTPVDFSTRNYSGYTGDYWFKTYGAQYKVDPNLLKAIATAESAGEPTAGSSAGACGLMQIMPATAKEVTGRAVSCDELKGNPALSIEIAAQYISQNQGNFQDRNDVIAGYNGGYDTSANSGHALAPSTDCAGVKAYQCCKNPGGLTETQNYVYLVNGYYNSYK